MMRLLLLLCCLLSQALIAAEQEKTATVSPWLYKKLTQTEKLINQKSYPAARQKLQDLLDDVEQGSYEQASVLRSLSSVYALQNQYRKAVQILKQCLGLNVLPPQQEQQSLLNLGQLYMATEQYQLAVETLEPWLAKHPQPNADTSALLANAYTQQKQYRRALPHIKNAIASRNKPPESWYQLNLALYYELDDYSSAAKLLNRLLHRYPDKKEYWSQLSSVYQQLKQYNKAVSVQHLAYQKGLLHSETEILALCNLFLYVGSPYKGAQLLAEALATKRVQGNSKNWETLANAWLQAKEFDKAITSLEKASHLHEKGRLYQQLGQIYVEQEEWSKAILAFNKALSKGGLEHPGKTYLLLGISYYESNNYDKARSAFNQAGKDHKQRRTASQWLDYLNSNENNS